MSVLIILTFLPYFQNDFGASSVGIGGGPITLNGKIEYISYNPASLAGINKTMALLGVQYISGERYTVFEYDEDTIFINKQSEFLPNIIGFVVPLIDNFSLGFTAAIPYRMQRLSEWQEERTIEEPEGSGIYFRYVESKKIYSLNIATAWGYSDNLSLGLNLSFLYERYNYGIEYSENGDQVPNIAGRLFGVEPCFGFQFQINDYFTLGGVVKKGVLKGNHYFSYFTLEDGRIIKSVWDDESVEMHIENPNQVYFRTEEEVIQRWKETKALKCLSACHELLVRVENEGMIDYHYSKEEVTKMLNNIEHIETKNLLKQ